MENHYEFDWLHLGNIDSGRKNLGENMPVFLHRLFEYTMRDAISTKYGNEAMIELFRNAGQIAGHHLYDHFFYKIADTSTFISKLQQTLLDLKIGVLRIESISPDGNITLTISEDLDCSGLPVIGETVCHYDEGFIAGIFSAFFNKTYTAEEIDCWAKGDRVCRFHAYVKKED